MRNGLSKAGRKHMTWASGALKAVFAMDSRDAALEKAENVAAEMESKGLKVASASRRPTCSTTTRASIGVGSAPTT